MDEIVIGGFEILQSVGAGGKNQPEDIDTIQILLNGIKPDQGGAFPPLKVLNADDSIDVLELNRMIESIRVFQQLYFHFDDGRVDPEQQTIRKMRQVFRKKDAPLPEEVLFIQPTQPFDGFDGSASPPWVLLSPTRPKMLRIENFKPAIDKIEVKETLAIVTTTAGEMISLQGRSGTGTMTITRGGEQMAELAIEVAPARTFSVFFHYVRGSANTEGTVHRKGEAAAMLVGVNRVYAGQANVQFTLAGEDEIDTINGKAVDFKQRSFLIADSAPPTGPQVFTWTDLVRESDKRGSAGCHIFFVKDVEHFPKSPKCSSCIGGTTMISTGPAIVEDSAVNTNRFVLLAHELGHFLGYPEKHESPPDSLMTPKIGPGMNFLKIYEQDFHKMNKPQ